MSEFLSDIDTETVSALKLRLTEEKSKRKDLEEELDLLAFENLQLRNQVGELQKRLAAAECDGYASRPISSASAETSPVDVEHADYSDLLADGDGIYPKIPVKKLSDVCGGGNVLASKYMTVQGANDIVIVGGVDKTLRGVDLNSSNVLFQITFAAPVLSISCHVNKIACGMMDGSFAVVIIDENELKQGGTLSTNKCWEVKGHTKYVVDVRWSSDGKYLATASHDKSVLLYKSSEIDDDSLPMRQINRKRFESAPESVTFLTDSAGASKLLIAVRESSNVLVLDCETLQELPYSMNSNTWDNHVSFNALYLATSPDQKYFSVSTDNSLHLIFRLENKKRLRTLASHTCGSYGKPKNLFLCRRLNFVVKVSWDCSGRYLASNSESDFGVHVYSVGSERIVYSGDSSVGGHKGQVRDIDYHATRRSFVTASFDHSVIEWA